MEWLTCPYCGVADHERLGSLVSDSHGETRTVRPCAECRGYFKTVTTLGPWLKSRREEGAGDEDLVFEYRSPRALGRTSKEWRHWKGYTANYLQAVWREKALPTLPSGKVMIQSTVPDSGDALTSSPTSTAPLGVSSTARPPETDRKAWVHSGSVVASATYRNARSKGRAISMA